MRSVSDIEKAIRSLPEGDLSRLRAWFAEFDAEVWDRDFESDVKAGRLDRLSADALDEAKQGNSTEL